MAEFGTGNDDMCWACLFSEFFGCTMISTFFVSVKCNLSSDIPSTIHVHFPLNWS